MAGGTAGTASLLTRQASCRDGLGAEGLSGSGGRLGKVLCCQSPLLGSRFPRGAGRFSREGIKVGVGKRRRTLTPGAVGSALDEMTL